MGVSEGLRAASSLCVSSSNGTGICEQNMYLLKRKNVFFDDDFRQDRCSGDLLGDESANSLALAFCVLRTDHEPIEMMSQDRRSDVFTRALAVEVLMTQAQSRPQLECNAFFRKQNVDFRCDASVHALVIRLHLTHRFRAKIPME